MSEKDNRIIIAGAMMLVAGGIIGAGLALLYAPQSGEKTRRQIARCARKVRNETEELIRDTADSISEMVEDLGEKTSDFADRGGDIAGDWRQVLLDAIDRGQKGFEKQRKKLEQVWG